MPKKISVLITCLLSVYCWQLPVYASTPTTIRVEGHAFAAQTRRPMPGVRVELWTFFSDGKSERRVATTDEGGLYIFEYQPTHSEQVDANLVSGYAFAFVCKYRDTQKVQVMPLYTSVERGVVYHRSVNLEVPNNVVACD